MNYGGCRVFLSCRDTDVHKLHGMKDTTICVTYTAYTGMSYAFYIECKIRNISLKILSFM